MKFHRQFVELIDKFIKRAPTIDIITKSREQMNQIQKDHERKMEQKARQDYEKKMQDKSRLDTIFCDPKVKFKFDGMKIEDRKTVMCAIQYFALTSLGDLHQIYKIKALKNHPDKGGDQEQFKMIVEYKDILMKLA